MKFAENTTVSVEKSKAEIEGLLMRYGATKIMTGWEKDMAHIAFGMNDRYVRFILPLPDPDEFETTPGGRRQRNSESKMQAWEQACRQRWRALALIIKAKLEAVESGIFTFEQEFLAHILLPNGETAGSFLSPIVNQAYDLGKMPPLQLPWEFSRGGEA